MLHRNSLLAVLALALPLTSLCFDNTTQATPTTPTFIVRNYTEQEAFDNLLQVLERMPFLNSNGFQFPVPSHPAFKDLAEHPAKIKNIDKDAYFKIFASEVYKTLDSTPAQTILDSDTQLPLVLKKLTLLQQRWGFAIFNSYTVVPTTYGPMGRYNPHTGLTMLVVDDNGFPVTSKRPLLVFAIVAIGINPIVEKYHLQFWEKLGLIDLICSLYLGDLLPDYHMQKSDDKKILDFITHDDICNDLPGAIERYVTLYPR